MTLTKICVRLARVGVALSALLVGCELVAGIESRELVDSPECAAYCDQVMALCTGNLAVYESRAHCSALCRLFDAGDSEASGNTLACRSRHLQGVSAAEAPSVCPVVGPGSGSPCVDSPCESYCRLLPRVCPTQATAARLNYTECLRECPALRPTSDFNVVDYTKGDSLGCRIYHLSAASILPDPHCGHSVIVPANAQQPCLDSAAGAPSCADYCRIMELACTGSEQSSVFESARDCEAFCGAFEKAGMLGKNLDLATNTRSGSPDNTIGCRKFHAYSALTNPELHCPHAGPTSNGYCGDEDTSICESYCALAKQGCAQQYAVKFASDDECQSFCGSLAGSTEESAEDAGLDYSVAIAKRGGVNAVCVTYHALAALSAPNSASAATECAAALGGAPCR